MHSTTTQSGRALLRVHAVLRRSIVDKLTKRDKGSVSSVIMGNDTPAEESPNPRPFEEIPRPRLLPIVGSLLDYSPLGPYSIEKFLDACVDRYRKFGKIWMETFGTLTTVNVVDPHDAEIMFKNDGRTPERPALEPLKRAREECKRSIGIANLQGDEWQRLRRIVQPFLMRPKVVEQYIPDLEDVGKDFISLIKERRRGDGEVPDFQNEIYKWALESIGKVALDTRLGCLEKNLDPDSEAQQIINASTDFFGTFGKLVYGFPIYKFISTPTWRKFFRSQETLFRINKKYVDQTIARVRDLKEGERTGEANMLVSLLGQKDLSYEELILTPIELIMGGIDTTSHTLVFNLYNLATNLDKQEKLYEEIVSVLPSSGKISAEALNKMAFLRGCMKETFRQYPIVASNARIIHRDLVLAGYTVPAGTMVRYHNITGMLEEYFPDPEKFVPERWIRGHQMQTHVSPFMVLPFGHGPRMCLGRRIAEEELRIIIVKLVQNYRITWKHGKLGVKMNIISAPDQPARFTFADRK